MLASSASIELWHWAAFIVLVAVLLVLDLFVFHRHAREPTLRESAAWTVVWCTLALSFNAMVWIWLGPIAGQEFLTGYLIEWSLSMDNVFVFAVIFSFFRVPLKYQYRVLFWGILGAVIMRMTFIVVGGELVQRFDWLLPIFGLFLIYTAAKLAFHAEEDVHPDQNIVLRIARRIFPVSHTLHAEETDDEREHAPGRHPGERFFIRQEGRLHVTPLFLVLLVVESTDVVFAVDSVPAILGVVTADAHYFKFVAFTSNVFAILGLRALYFLLAGMLDLFRYLHFGLSAVLAFVGLKMLADYALELELTEPYVPGWVAWALHHRWVSLLVIVSLLAISIVVSLMAERRDSKRAAAGSTGAVRE